MYLVINPISQQVISNIIILIKRMLSQVTVLCSMWVTGDFVFGLFAQEAHTFGNIISTVSTYTATPLRVNTQVNPNNFGIIMQFRF